MKGPATSFSVINENRFAVILAQRAPQAFIDLLAPAQISHFSEGRHSLAHVFASRSVDFARRGLGLSIRTCSFTSNGADRLATRHSALFSIGVSTKPGQHQVTCDFSKGEKAALYKIPNPSLQRGL